MITVHRHPRRAAAALVALGVLLVVAACSADPARSALPEASGATAPTTAGASPTASLDPEDALIQYARCMREHGVDMPDPVDGRLTLNGEGIGPEKMEAADSACEKWQEMAESQDGGGRQLTEDEKQVFLDQATCLRDRGWNVSDPVFDSDGGVKQQFGRSQDPQPGDPVPGDPQFEKDMTECAHEVGLELPDGGSTGGGEG
ncbi:hypothetical protein [Cellulomonas sp. URHE0023]|uniref:hypothetical protein n=1 Tax=Cellulomonas sp. URHE0023 TaxID=1380354 RepID=UPI0012DE17F6|nr:hypothetical protein [Cellulomonas sp. URHE0023]